MAAIAGNRCHFVLLDKDESCPTADLSNLGCHNGPAYSTSELLNMSLIFVIRLIKEFLREVWCEVNLHGW